MSSAWIYQDDKQVKKHSADAANWYVGWIVPEGKRRCKSCGLGKRSRRNAEKLRKKTEAELLTGTYQAHERKTWDEFIEEYARRVLAGLAPRSRESAETALAHFKRIVRPKRVSALSTARIDDYTAAQRKEAGKKRRAGLAGDRQ
jgi:hypothetical protein